MGDLTGEKGLQEGRRGTDRFLGRRGVRLDLSGDSTTRGKRLRNILDRGKNKNRKGGNGGKLLGKEIVSHLHQGLEKEPEKIGRHQEVGSQKGIRKKTRTYGGRYGEKKNSLSSKKGGGGEKENKYKTTRGGKGSRKRESG